MGVKGKYEPGESNHPDPLVQDLQPRRTHDQV